MPYNRLSASKIAKAVGCHANTVRLYEEWGFLPPVPRAPNGYRLYSTEHLDQMRLARAALNTPWPGRAIRRSGLEIVSISASGDLGAALEKAYQHLALIQSERALAETTAELVSRWARGVPADSTRKSLRIGDAAAHLQVSVDQLRGWERNGLLDIPRNPSNGYRLFGAPELARVRIIRMLRNAGYSLMAILRMLNELNRDQNTDVRQALDTPSVDEDVQHATDQWLTTLQAVEDRAREIIVLLEERLQKTV
jgi:DNA-binding transcriptional MerR regulator